MNKKHKKKSEYMNQLTSNLGKMVIAGPCALESRQQLKECVGVLKQMGVSMIRASLWKPRTQPGWEGLGWMSLPLLLEETLPHGLVPATEIISAEHALMVVHALEHFGHDARMIVWLGSRNQNHLEQKKIAKILATGPAGITFMFKNQMWEDERHWLGIYEHIVSEGFPQERLMICHRGFSPGKSPNPKGLRNLPDFEMAMRIKKKTGLPMLLDPSHIGGSLENVVDICTMASAYDFDGYLVEMHCDPERAKTDAKQQLSPTQFQDLLKTIRCAACKKEVA
jgi:3-deoxy-D-arabino-heptulosonate 7-phosphate (DAHP) synthase